MRRCSLSSSAERWNAAYVGDVPPWDVPHPDPMLVQAVERGDLPRGRLLDIGCGTGTQARYLHDAGFQVVGVDFAPLAIELARERSPADITFHVHDVLAQPLPDGPFDAVFDRGCFHVFAEADERTLFVQRVFEALRPGGRWLSLLGSTEGGARSGGPPRRTARDIVNAVEPHLALERLSSRAFGPELDGHVAWYCLASRRTVLAQPSSRRH